MVRTQCPRPGLTRILPNHEEQPMPKSTPHTASPETRTAKTHTRHGSPPPAMRIYNALRRAKGLTHEEATRHLRRTLKRYFRAA
jgi:hypothetical protein